MIREGQDALVGGIKDSAGQAATIVSLQQAVTARESELKRMRAESTSEKKRLEQVRNTDAFWGFEGGAGQAAAIVRLQQAVKAREGKLNRMPAEPRSEKERLEQMRNAEALNGAKGGAADVAWDGEYGARRGGARRGMSEVGREKGVGCGVRGEVGAKGHLTALLRMQHRTFAPCPAKGMHHVLTCARPCLACTQKILSLQRECNESAVEVQRLRDGLGNRLPLLNKPITMSDELENLKR